jgi:hypothetical protein
MVPGREPLTSNSANSLRYHQLSGGGGEVVAASTIIRAIKDASTFASYSARSCREYSEVANIKFT